MPETEEDRPGGSEDLAISLTILRIVRRWSQSELAAAAGVSNSAISDYERAKVDPQTQTLRKLLGALGVSHSALDLTQAFILSIRAQMLSTDVVAGPLGGALPQSLEMEIAQVASEAGRVASRLAHTLLHLLARRDDSAR